MNFDSLFKSLDAFGTATSLNFKGHTTYNTRIGALFSITIKAFMLVFAVQQFTALVSYEDSEVSIY